MQKPTMKPTPYIKFKKLFKGDQKLNIVALDRSENVLAHRALLINSFDHEILNDILREMRDEIKRSKIRNKIKKYEVVYPQKV